MILNGISFGPVWGAAGVLNFDGRGYWYHKYLKLFGLNFKGMTHASKTSTWLRQPGNMPLKDDGMTPKEWKPSCIYVDHIRRIALNAIDLSGFGLEFYLKSGIWENQDRAFWISFMAVGKTREARMAEYQNCAAALKNYRARLSLFGLQVNISCFNTGLKLEVLLLEVADALQILSTIGVPLQVKISALPPIEIAIEIARDPNCHSLCVSNAIPYGSYFEPGWWKKNFGSVSPLQRFRGGALSGAPLRDLTCRWIYSARKRGLSKPINGGGGILEPTDVDFFHYNGADSIFLGSIAFLRPTRVAATIARGYKLYGDD